MSEPPAAAHNYNQEIGASLEALLKRIARKDSQALEAFYDLTVNRVYGLAVRITRKDTLAEEVVCDVYYQVWSQAGQFDAQRGEPMAWVMMICRSRALDTVRRNRNDYDLQALPDEEFVSPERPPEDLLLNLEENAVVHDALTTLDEDQRQLIALAYFRGYSHSELAAFTGLALGTVKSRLRRALLLLKEQISKKDASRGQYGPQ